MPSQPRQSAPSLSAADQHALRFIVDALHIGTSPTRIVRHLRDRLKTTPKLLRKAAYTYALQWHADNLALYCAVTGSL